MEKDDIIEEEVTLPSNMTYRQYTLILHGIAQTIMGAASSGDLETAQEAAGLQHDIMLENKQATRGSIALFPSTSIGDDRELMKELGVYDEDFEDLLDGEDG